MIIDSHCHLEYEPLSENLDGVVDRALKSGVKYFLTISTTDKSFDNWNPALILISHDIGFAYKIVDKIHVRRSD